MMMKTRTSTKPIVACLRNLTLQKVVYEILKSFSLIEITDFYWFHWFIITLIITFVTRPEKTGLIYTKYICLYYGTYLLFCIHYPKSVSFIEFLMDLCIYDDILNTIQITDKMLLHFKLSKSGQILRVDKTCFPRPGQNFNCSILEVY